RPAEEVAVREPEPRIDEDALTVAPPSRTRPPVRAPQATPSPAPESRPPRPGRTVVGPAPTADEAHPTFDEAEEAPTVMVPTEAREAARRELQAQRDAARRAAEAEDELDVDVEPEEATPSERNRIPPHTPPGRAKPARSEQDEEATEAEPKPRRKRPRLEALGDLEQEVPPPGMSTLGIVMVVLLTLLAGGLVAASVALEDTVDPRPLLEKLYRQYVKGE
ncbi:MAG: hypothetical protein KC501_20850, partial [Myxococcales bacterium]|nr:hypothetical protein [Myxococcales bacterium]